MPKMNENKRRLIQVSLSEEEYQLIRKRAYEMDVSVNVALRELALLRASGK